MLSAMRALCAVASLLILAGCGGSASDKPEAAPTTTPSPTPSATPTENSTDALKQAVKKYSDAFLTGRSDEAYALFSERCQKRMSKAEFAGIVAQAKQTYGTALPLKTFDAKISGDLARVTYTYDVAEINQDSEPWVREGGDWHEDDC